MKYKIEKNPKSVDDYINMLSKLHKAMITFEEKTMELGFDFFSQYFLKSSNITNHPRFLESPYVLLKILFGQSFAGIIHEQKMFYNKYLDFLEVNHRIEAMMKFIRYYMSRILYSDLLEIVNWVNEKHPHMMDDLSPISEKYHNTLVSIMESYDKSFEVSNLTQKDIDIFYTGRMEILREDVIRDIRISVKKKLILYSIKIYSNTYNEFFAHSLGDIIGHILNTAKNNKRRYKAILDFSWANKNIADIVSYMVGLYSAISSKYSASIEEYVEAYGRRKKETEILKLNHHIGGYSWWLLMGGNHPFESFIGSRPMGSGNHCGSDGRDVFFSLRRIDPEMTKELHEAGHRINFYESVATISADMIATGNAKMPSLFLMAQAKGVANNPIPHELWPLIMDLYELPEIIGELSHRDDYNGYKQENDFNTLWLKGEHHTENFKIDKYLDIKIDDNTKKRNLKRYNDFLRLKPYWNNLYKTFLDFGLHDKLDILKPERTNAVKTEINEDGVVLYYNHLNEMLLAIDNKFKWGSRTFPSNLIKMLDDPYSERVADVSIDMKDYDYIKYYDFIESQFPDLFHKMQEDDNIKDQVNDCSYRAEYTGYEVGTIDEFYSSVERHFDGEVVEEYLSDEVGDIEICSFNKVTVKKESYWTINLSSKYCEIAFLNMPDKYASWPRVYLESLEKTDLTWDYEFDEEAAMERFEVELSEEGLI